MSRTQLLETFIKQLDGLGERLADSRQETQQLDELVQSHSRLRQENERLRGLLRELVTESYWDGIRAHSDDYTLVPNDLLDKVEKELERCGKGVD